MLQREVRFSTSRPVEHESLHSRQTSDSHLQQILDLPLPSIHPDLEYDALDPWTSASLNGFKLDTENAESLKIDLNKEEACSPNGAGWTPLMYSAYLGQIESTRRLLELNINTEQRNSLGQTALMLAATCGNEQMIRLLLKYTTSPKVTDRSGRTALHYAILYGQQSLIEPLLAQGFDPNLVDQTDNQMTPMLIACKAGRKALVDELLKHNGNPRLRNARGQHGLALAEAGEHQDVIKRLQWHFKLHEMFEKEDLLKYLPAFEIHEISESKFLSLTTQKLSDMGITLLGPQKKIESLRKQLAATRLSEQTTAQQKLTTEQAQNSGTSTNSGLQTNGNHEDLSYKQIANEQAHRLKKMTEQLSHQYVLNEKIIDRLKDLCGTRHSNAEAHLRAIIQALDESNQKTLALLKQ